MGIPLALRVKDFGYFELSHMFTCHMSQVSIIRRVAHITLVCMFNKVKRQYRTSAKVMLKILELYQYHNKTMCHAYDLGFV